MCVCVCLSVSVCLCVPVNVCAREQLAHEHDRVNNKSMYTYVVYILYTDIEVHVLVCFFMQDIHISGTLHDSAQICVHACAQPS